MAKGKVQKSGPFGGAMQGGSTKMFGQQGANPAKPGAVALSQPGKGAQFAKGGSTKMFGRQYANPRKSGVTGK